MALRHSNPALVAGTFLVSLGFLYFAVRLALIRSSQSARRLLLVSVVYLPFVFFQSLEGRTPMEGRPTKKKKTDEPTRTYHLGRHTQQKKKNLNTPQTMPPLKQDQ